MDDFETPPSGAALALLHDPLLNEILDAMESEAIERGILANPSDDEQRRVSMMEARAIRSLREQLKTRAAGKTKLSHRVPVA